MASELRGPGEKEQMTLDSAREGGRRNYKWSLCLQFQLRVCLKGPKREVGILYCFETVPKVALEMPGL